MKRIPQCFFCQNLTTSSKNAHCVIKNLFDKLDRADEPLPLFLSLVTSKDWMEMVSSNLFSYKTLAQKQA